MDKNLNVHKFNEGSSRSGRKWIDLCQIHTFQNGPRCENVKNKTMEQAPIRERGARMPLSALHIENAAIFCYWRCVFICYFFHDNDDIELCVQ